MNIRNGLLLTLVLLLPAALAACGSAPETPVARIAGGGHPLADATWRLKSYAAADTLKSVLPGSEITLIFDTAAGRLMGSAGCNQYGAGFTTDGDRLTVAAIVATKKFCSEPAGVMTQEQEYLTLLQGAARYEITKATLEIFTSDKKLLRFTAR